MLSGHQCTVALACGFTALSEVDRARTTLPGAHGSGEGPVWVVGIMRDEVAPTANRCDQLATTLVVTAQFIGAFSQGLSDSQNDIGLMGVPLTDQEFDGVRSRTS